MENTGDVQSKRASSQLSNRISMKKSLYDFGKNYFLFYFFLIFAGSVRRPKCLAFCNLQFYVIICLNNLREKAIFIKQLSKEYIYFFQPYVVHVYL